MSKSHGRMSVTISRLDHLFLFAILKFLIPCDQLYLLQTKHQWVKQLLITWQKNAWYRKGVTCDAKSIQKLSWTASENGDDLRCFPNLRKLRFSGFEGPVFLPNSLRAISFGTFNAPLRIGLLPDGLEKLQFQTFNQPLQPKTIPHSVTELRFGIAFNQFLGPNVLPSSLITLIFPSRSRFNSSVVLPMNVQNAQFGISFSRDLNVTCLQRLRLGNYFTGSIGPNPMLTNLCWLPSSPLPEHLVHSNSLRNLFVDRAPMEFYPPNLTTLTVWMSSVKLIHLPTTLQKLTLPLHFNEPLFPGALPPMLTSLDMGLSYSHDLFPGILPNSLRKFTLGSTLFMQQFKTGWAPTDLMSLKFNPKHQREWHPGYLPSKLRKLKLTQHYDINLILPSIPRHLSFLSFQSSSIDEKFLELLHHILPNALIEILDFK
jgi:hypothetical protein